MTTPYPSILAYLNGEPEPMAPAIEQDFRRFVPPAPPKAAQINSDYNPALGVLVIVICILFAVTVLGAPLFWLLNHGPSDEARVSATYNRPPYAR